MALALGSYQRKAREATMAFWGNREQARKKQIEAGKADQGERAGVTAGKNMDGFAALAIDIIKKNGLKRAQIHRNRALVTLPGFFRPTKLWDIVVVNEGRLMAAIEFKSQVGPSFGNNFNNRAEEAIGTGHDFWTAFREGAFGDHAKPFLAWFMMVEDAPGSRSPVRDASPHFPVLADFQGACYLDRYNILCKKLVQEQLYTAATIISSSRESIATGRYQDHSEITSLKSFVVSLASYAAAESAR